MSKNKRYQRRKIFGGASSPAAGSKLRQKHLNHISLWVESFCKVPNRVTLGKRNKAGKFILKPNWKTGFLEYEPNPDAAVHEIAHLFLASSGEGLSDIQASMDNQYGLSQSLYGYAQQKRTLFEVLPMGLEQKIRRVLGLPACKHYVKVNEDTPPRVLAENKSIRIAKRVMTPKGAYRDLIRLSSNLDAGCIERFDKILSGELIFDVKRGWINSNSIDAKINRRARLSAKRKACKLIVLPAPPDVLDLSKEY